MELPSARSLIGGLLVVVTTAGFEFEVWWLFLGGLFLFLAWCGALLFAPDDS